MEFDIPEENYRDVEDDGMNSLDRFNKELGFVKQFIFSGFVNHSRCSHLCHAMDWMVSDSPNKQEHVDSHREWIRLLDEAEKTMKIEPKVGISFEELKKRFDEMMANTTDEELVAKFEALDCEVEIRKDTYGDDIIPEDLKY